MKSDNCCLLSRQDDERTRIKIAHNTRSERVGVPYTGGTGKEGRARTGFTHTQNKHTQKQSKYVFIGEPVTQRGRC